MRRVADYCRVVVTRRVTFSFVALVLVSFLVLSFMGWQMRETRRQGRETRQVAAHARTLAEQNRVLARANKKRAVENRRLALEGRQAHDGLCALRHDLELRVAAARDYLRANPNGVPGIPAAMIRNSIANQQQTVNALSGLHCTTREEKA